MTASTKGVRNPQIPTQERTIRNDPITPHTVILGITLGQYTPQNSRDAADTLNVGLLGNLHGRYIVKYSVKITFMEKSAIEMLKMGRMMRSSVNSVGKKCV
mmetsp:Transcript_37745/g.55668  ORF Transcript_37745/g.55668 Transcript_37745/m.55668 type:complete len:101 (+) Transcript_37745:860-1162(+)|eukprot:scaffold3706_cov124-Skeletonema_dohrnii-CCMP3373.AAC.6